MNNSLDRYLAGEAPLHPERLELPTNEELDAAEAEYDAIMAQRHRRPSALLVAFRIITSVAAIYLVGLFFYLQTDTPTKPVVAQNNNNVEKKQSAPQPEYCTEGTPREILLCYLERKQAMPNTYSQLKRMSDENK